MSRIDIAEQVDVSLAIGDRRRKKMPLQTDALGILYTQSSATDPSAITLAAILADTAAIQAAVEIIDDWDGTHDSPVGADGVQLIGEARTALGAAVANGDAVRLITDLHGRLMLANHTIATRSNRSEEIDPLDQKFLGETLCDVTNYNGPATFDYYFDMDGYRYFTLQGVHTPAAVDTLTMTVEATVQDDGTAPAACAYQDVTNALFGVANWVDTDFIAIVDTPVAFKYVHFQVVVAGGNDDADLAAYVKRMF